MPARGLVQRYFDGEVTFEAFQQRIAEREPSLHCWVQVRPEDPPPDGPFRGMPYGAKDIIDAAGYRTTLGSPIYANNVAESDAAIITSLRERGARLMGKTQTTAFAYYDPAPTRNPHNPAHTPGGSSSGSAAAVAAGMVPFALGSQTQGSVLRPASFCGVTGLKPTHGVLPLGGVMPFAPSLDTLGLFTQTALDMRLVWEALGFPVESEPPDQYGWIEFETEEPMDDAVRDTAVALGNLGIRVHRVSPPDSFRALSDAVPIVNKYEGARTHEKAYRDHGNAIGAKMAQLVRDGLAIPEAQYQEALAAFRLARFDMTTVFGAYPVILSAAAPGPAPASLSSTGDPRCNAPFTALHVPAITIPMSIHPDALPLGLQMAAAPNQEALLLTAAAQCQALLSAQAHLGLN